MCGIDILKKRLDNVKKTVELLINLTGESLKGDVEFDVYERCQDELFDVWKSLNSDDRAFSQKISQKLINLEKQIKITSGENRCKTLQEK